MNSISKLLPTAAFLATASTAAAQTTTQNDQQSRQQDRINSIFGALFGERSGLNDSQTDNDVRSGALDQRTAVRLKTDYAELVQLELRYGANRRFTMQERSELAERYNALTQVLTNQTYGDDDDVRSPNVAEGESEFIARVDASLAARHISRVTGNRLKADYRLLTQTEANYLRDGVLDERERDDLDARLATIANAISSNNFSAAAQAQFRVEHSDLSYLQAAYARLTMTADDRRHLESRLSDLERRLQIRNR